MLIKTTENHFEAIKEKRIAEILNSYADSEDLLVFVEGPRWETLGYENVAKGWRDFIGSEIYVKKCVCENRQDFFGYKLIALRGFVNCKKPVFHNLYPSVSRFLLNKFTRKVERKARPAATVTP